MLVLLVLIFFRVFSYLRILSLIVLDKLYTVWWNLNFLQTFWQTICDFIFTKNGIRFNKLMSFTVKMKRYDIFLFSTSLFDFYILLPKQYLLWDQVIFFGNCCIVNSALNVLSLVLLFGSWLWTVKSVFIQ